MDFKAYQYVMKVAAKGNFTKAAAELYISQPALSQYISAVEADLGVALFDRTSYPITLTPAGEVFIEYGRTMMGVYDDMLSHLRQAGSDEGGQLRIACSNFRGYATLPRFLSGFSLEHPKIKVELLEAEKVRYETLVLNDEVDFAVYSNEGANPALFDLFPLCREEMLVVLPPNHPLHHQAQPSDIEGQPPEIDLKLLKNDNFILLQKNQGTYKQAVNLCVQSGFFPHIVLQTPLFISGYAYAMAGIGDTFIPSSYFNALGKPDYRYAYRIAPYYPQKTIYLMRKKGGTKTPAINSFLEHVEKLAFSFDSPF